MNYQAEIPYGGLLEHAVRALAGRLAHLHSIEFAAHVAKRELERRRIDARVSTTACSASACRRSTRSTACPG